MFAAYEMENHLLICEYSQNGAAASADVKSEGCTFHYCGCTWKGQDKEELNEHLKQDLNQHLEVNLIPNFALYHSYLTLFLSSRCWSPPSVMARI